MAKFWVFMLVKRKQKKHTLRKQRMNAYYNLRWMHGALFRAKLNAWQGSEMARGCIQMVEKEIGGFELRVECLKSKRCHHACKG